MDRAAPNIVVLIADDLGKSSLGCYGDPHVRTPHLDRLARAGMRFERAYVTSPQCSPSRSSLVTSRTPHAIGTSRLHAELRREVPTILEGLRNRGYFTGAFRKHHLGAELQQRFDLYGDDDTPFAAFFDRRPTQQPFFLWVGFHDPHRDLYTNYEPIRGRVPHPHDPAKVVVPPFLPDTPAMRADLALHYDAISRLDTDCGVILRLLEQRGIAENTMVVFVSDHGMPYPRAKATLYDAGVNVPLLVRWPGRVASGSVNAELISTLDLPATWLDVAGAPPLPAMEGRSLVDLLTGVTHTSRDFVFTERNWHDTWEPARGVVSRTHALICNYRPEVSYRGSLDHESAPPWSIFEAEHAAGRLRPELGALLRSPRPSVELYDLACDPAQFRNLATEPAMAPLKAELLGALDLWMRETNDFLPPPATFPEIRHNVIITLERVLDGPLAKR